MADSMADPILRFECGNAVLATGHWFMDFDDVEQLRWTGSASTFVTIAERLDAVVTDSRRPWGRRSLSPPILGSATVRPF
jgi:hypothetical protein